ILRFRNKTTSLIYDYVKERSDIEIVTSNNRYLRFVSPQIREAVGLIGSGKWSGIKDLIVYEIEVPKEGKPKLTLYIGPGIQDDRQKWNDFALKQSMLSTVTKDNNVNGNWKAIYRVQLSKDIRTYKTEDECAKEINEYLDKWFGSDFIKINDIFKRQ
ncbi:MAG: hypothetical protein J5955_04865, partial [Bacilli bacterium]|nr:hypothetical protein [Bacilli bacterium]